MVQQGWFLFEHLCLCILAFEHSSIFVHLSIFCVWALVQLCIWAFVHLSSWAFVHLSIWAFVQLCIWAFVHLLLGLTIVLFCVLCWLECGAGTLRSDTKPPTRWNLRRTTCGNWRMPRSRALAWTAAITVSSAPYIRIPTPCFLMLAKICQTQTLARAF